MLRWTSTLILARLSQPKEPIMHAVNMLQAKSNLSRLVESLEQGTEREIIIARNGRPAARLVPIDTAVAPRRLGVAKGQFEMPDSIDTHQAEVARLFLGPA
jgi:prevent-host-death family protein